VRVFLTDLPFDVQPARADLGFAPRELEVGLRETIAWLQAGRPGTEAAASRAGCEAMHGKEVAA
jgi:hypothetical protein